MAIALFVLLVLVVLALFMLWGGPERLLWGPWLPAWMDQDYLAAVEQHKSAVARYDAKIAAGWTPEEIANGGRK